jgi:hypothetical protein
MRLRGVNTLRATMAIFALMWLVICLAHAKPRTITPRFPV